MEYLRGHLRVHLQDMTCVAKTRSHSLIRYLIKQCIKLMPVEQENAKQIQIEYCTPNDNEWSSKYYGSFQNDEVNCSTM